jgi:hypothetical protein
VSKSFVNDILDLAEEQGWIYRKKDDGYLVFPPRGEPQFIRDPGNESHTQRNIRYRLFKAGLKFPEEKSVTEPPYPPKQIPVPPAPVVSVFTQARQKINAAVNLLSEAEQLINKAEADNQQLQKLRELLKTL